MILIQMFLFLGNEDSHITSVVSSETIATFQNGSLAISSVSKSDEGLYKCNASNGVGNSLEATMALRVIGMFFLIFKCIHIHSSEFHVSAFFL